MDKAALSEKLESRHRFHIARGSSLIVVINIHFDEGHMRVLVGQCLFIIFDTTRRARDVSRCV